VLAARWWERYALSATLIPNGVDVDAVRGAELRELAGAAPHAVYVGTVHANRVDVDLVAELAAAQVATVHLVGPERLSGADRGRLRDAGVRLHGPVRSADVPGWLISADVLICPHLVDEFTLSLDAIKAHEYLATYRPVVATPSCGFQDLTAAGLTVVARAGFVDAARAAVGTGPFPRPAPPSWDERAASFAAVLHSAAER
jgi:glycosyltransferase involved in cell wall biosynthesis